MSRLKSLGLAGARTATTRALRKLFRLPQPAGEGGSDDLTSKGAGGSAATLSTTRTTTTTAATTATTTTTTTAAVATGTAHGAAASGNDENTDTDTDTDTNTDRDAGTHTNRETSSGINGDTMATRVLQEKKQQQQQQQQQPQQQPSSLPQHAQQRRQPSDKENDPPEDDATLAVSLAGVNLAADELDSKLVPTVDVIVEPTLDAVIDDPVLLAERAHHLRFIGEALDMARLALKTNETPVGCVLVHQGTIIAKGMNATNVTRNGTRHAEFMALSALLSYPPKDGPRTTRLKPKQDSKASDEASDSASLDSRPLDDGNEDGSKGHLYPYGQKFHADLRVDREIIRESILYVTVEPCVMCASLLRQFGVKKVYFGAVNDKFGGTGGVFSIHANSLPVRADGQTASAHPVPKSQQLPFGGGSLGTSLPPDGGDGGNVEPGYEVEGGWGRDEAVALLRRFYVQENGRAPVPRKKEGRAARLAAMMEKDGNASATSLLLDSASGRQQDEDADSEDAAAYGVDTTKENYEPEKQSNYRSTDAPLYGDEDSDGEDEMASYR